MWWLIVLLVLLALWLAVGFGAFAVFSLRQRFVDPASPEAVQHSAYARFSDQISAGQDWLTAQNPERVETTSFDGIKLVGRYIPCENARGTAILFHGYRSQWNLDFSCSVSYYHSLGFALLLVDQRAHGESGGHYITYGVKERRDVLSWIDYVNLRFGDNTPILIGGLSMGASTVQMACGLGLPENVRAAVSDCGFTTPYEIGVHVLRRRKLPVWLLLPQVELFCRLLAGFGLKECSTLTAQRRNRIPTFFVHGEDDNLVPCEMTLRNYKACRAEKHLLTVPGATHGVSYLVDQPRYEREIKEFLDRYF